MGVRAPSRAGGAALTPAASCKLTPPPPPEPRGLHPTYCPDKKKAAAAVDKDNEGESRGGGAGAGCGNLGTAGVCLAVLAAAALAGKLTRGASGTAKGKSYGKGKSTSKAASVSAKSTPKKKKAN